MFYVIEGREYPAMTPKTFGLNVLRDIKRATGLKPSELDVLVQQLAKRERLADIIDDEASLLAFSVLVWASRRAAGEHVDMETACDFDMSTFEVRLTDEEREELRRPPTSDHEPPDPRKARSPRKPPAGKRTGRKVPAVKAGRSTT